MSEYTPMAYQIEGAEFLAQRENALLADEPGLGKTAQAILAADMLGANKILCAVPAVVVPNWHREMNMWRRKGNEGVTVESYDKIVRDPERYLQNWDVVIPDEGHYLKTRTSKRTKVMYGEKCDRLGGIVERAEAVMPLSGTPMPNHPAELWPMCRAVFKGSDLDMSYWAFVNQFCTTKDNGFGPQISGGKNLPLLKKLLQPHFLRRRVTDVIKDMPSIRYTSFSLDVEKIPVPDSDMKKKIEAALVDDDPISALARISPHVATYRRIIGQLKAKPTADLIKAELEDSEKKIIVFAYHTEVLHELRRRIGANICAYVDGSINSKMRDSEVQRFQSDRNCRVFIGQNTAAGIGITLTAAQDVLIVEPDWTPSNNEQMGKRCHRIGQTGSVLVRFIYIPDSLDEAISNVVRHKTAMIGQVFGKAETN